MREKIRRSSKVQLTRAFNEQAQLMKSDRNHDMLQLFFALNLLLVGDLHVIFFALFTKLFGQMFCVVVSAYDLRCDLTDGGNGKVSIE